MMNPQERLETIRSRLMHAFTPIQLDVEDQSHLHVGHPGAKSGAGHFAVQITSELFQGKKEIERHRMIYQTLDDLIPTEIHALAIKTATPN